VLGAVAYADHCALLQTNSPSSLPCQPGERSSMRRFARGPHRGSLANPRIRVVDYKAIYKGQGAGRQVAARRPRVCPLCPSRKLAVFTQREGVPASLFTPLPPMKSYRRAVITGRRGVLAPPNLKAWPASGSLVDGRSWLADGGMPTDSGKRWPPRSALSFGPGAIIHRCMLH